MLSSMMGAKKSHAMSDVQRVLGLSATEQAQALARGEFSPKDLLLLYLERIARYNDTFNAYTYVSRRRSVQAAESAELSGPLGGVPVAIKDLNPTRGMPVRFGSRSMRYFISPVDDPVSQRIKAAGLPILGKLATSELGHLPVTEPLIHPPTRNPRAPERSAGGSSGGSAAAVAAGLVPVAHGSDGAGSIRIPAAFCGLIGFKPSRRMTVGAPKNVDIFELSVNGPIARTVDDAAALLSVLARDEERFTFTAPPAPKKRLRVALTLGNPICAVDPEHQAAARLVADWFARQGHEVVEQPWFAGTLEEFLPVWQRFMFRLRLPRTSLMMPSLRWLREGGEHLRTEDVIALKASIEARVDAWFGDIDVWISPTVPRSAPQVGEARALSPKEYFTHMADYGSFTAPFNLSGQCAASIPVATHSNGAPIGVQLAGRRAQDGALLSILKSLERDQVFARPSIAPMALGPA